MSRRTTFQLAFLIMGLVIWGYGQRIDDPAMRLVGIAFFAVATLLRFFRRSDTRPHQDEEENEPTHNESGSVP
ncbi:MAG TPA: hypothetical protein VFO55_08930 [Gemmatimonadaceae bacterium]|nr:hypothetical protein [Gemmatimonadaceae bacterium]